MRIGRLILRVMAVGLLMGGIVAMHHVAGLHDSSAAHSSSAVTGHDASAQAPVQHGAASGDGVAADENHGLLHLCLAVLTAAAAFVAALLLVGWRGMPMLPRLRPAAFLEPRIRPPPRRHGVSLLMFVCVLRT